MAALAHRLEIARRTVFRFVIEMSDGEDDNRVCVRVPLAMLGNAATAMLQAAMPFAFAPAVRAFEPDAGADGFPVLRIAGAVFRSDGHYAALRHA